MGRNYTILALGSRGDVQPFVALGAGLCAAGHGVRIAAAEDYGPLVTEHGLPFHPLVGRIVDLMDRELVYDAFDAGANPIPFGLRFREAVAPLMESLLRDCMAASAEADALVVSTLGVHPGEIVAQERGLPVIEAHFHPVAPTRTLPHAFFPELLRLPDPLRGAYNRLSHTLGDRGMRQFFRPALNRARRSLGLQRRSSLPTKRLSLHAYSPHIAPPPQDWDPAYVPVTGYWPLSEPSGYHLPPELEDFLQDGPPPIYIGFGSLLAGRDPDGMTRLLFEGLEQAELRGILHRGWGDFGNIPVPPTVHLTEGAYHSVLFPRVAGVIHHGGAGTTAAALRAGIPAVVVPYFGDQCFWARRLYELGVSPPPIPRDALTVEGLAQALRRIVENPAYRDRVSDLKTRLLAEDGIGNAVRLLDNGRENA
jgi:UDP:flavonoid glycosyltransferase YjiC (YdhE family)